jgi:hypothetical protein
MGKASFGKTERLDDRRRSGLSWDARRCQRKSRAGLPQAV